MPEDLVPSQEKIMEILPLERQPYILGQVALVEGDQIEMINALEELHGAYVDGVLRPPMPNVIAGIVERVVNDARQGNPVDRSGLRLLLATVIDFGNVRYDTDPSHRERERNQPTSGSRTIKVRPNPPIIPPPTGEPRQ